MMRKARYHQMTPGPLLKTGLAKSEKYRGSSNLSAGKGTVRSILNRRHPLEQKAFHFTCLLCSRFVKMFSLRTTTKLCAPKAEKLIIRAPNQTVEFFLRTII